ncbi:MAG: nucleoside triphosphate pyrophosphohydrolase, partial [Gammaproteobacteria bacterium]|nr:nucleoside triphosphate pyrophosphohydrolase [Gammaproteobacteria bacterium]
EEHKATERAAKQNTSASVLASVPINFPGLLRAQKLSKKAASVGFDWPDIESVFGKVQEEILELTQAINHKDQSAISEEIGDLLFAISNIARKQDVDAESALQDASHKFTRRFRFIETKLHKQGMTVEDASLHEMEELWQQAKRINPI